MIYGAVSLARKFTCPSLWCIQSCQSGSTTEIQFLQSLSYLNCHWTKKVCTFIQLAIKLLSNCFLCIDCVSSSQMDCSWRAGTRANNSYAPPPTTQHGRHPIILAVWLTDGNPLGLWKWGHSIKSLRARGEIEGTYMVFVYTPHLSKNQMHLFELDFNFLLPALTTLHLHHFPCSEN